MVSKKYLKHLKSQEHTENFIYEAISRRISFLLQYCDSINKHPEELEKSLFELIKRERLEPAFLLREVIIQDIEEFYIQALGDKKKKDIAGKNLPKYFKQLKKFRNKVAGHHQNMSAKKIVELSETINKIGLKRIFKDYLNFRDIILVTKHKVK